MQLERIEISKLVGDPANARKHGERNLDSIVASLTRFGQQKPIVIDRAGVVRAGNGTLEAARSMGWTHIDCVRTALDGSDAIAYAIADNRTAELAEWDTGVLAATLEGLDLEGMLDHTGFDQSELDALLKEVGAALSDEIPEDEVPEPPAEPAYCDVIVQRWETLTGRKAALDDTRHKDDTESNAATMADKTGVSSSAGGKASKNNSRPKKQPA